MADERVQISLRIDRTLADAIYESERPEDDADTAAAQLRRLRADVAKSVAVLLVSAGKATPDRARDWVKPNLPQALPVKQRAAA